MQNNARDIRQFTITVTGEKTMNKYSVRSVDGTMDNVMVWDNEADKMVEGVVDAKIQFDVVCPSELTFTVSTNDFNIDLPVTE
jgi:hypothetical protein